ncbi:MAG: hypothetical protein JSS66_02045 [Armatimonadetes bacterium]|nr:hypothetical protein [Armatimonadota bacterium]
MKNTLRNAVLLALSVSLAAPTISYAMPQSRDSVRHRNQKKDEWKNIGIASAAAAVLGIIGKNGTVTTLGTVGALYSAWRYEEDRKSANRMERQRAELYSRSSVNYNGHRYKRKTVYKGGKKYYQFVRA